MPTCGSCEQKLLKSQFARDQLRLGPERRCKACIEATQSLFSKALTTRRFDEVSTDSQVERLRSRDANTQMDAANKLWTLTRRGSEKVDRDIAAAGAIRPLVELLRARSDDRAWTAAMTLQALSCRSDARKSAIVEAGAVPLLVALLSGPSEDDKEVAAMVLHNLAFSFDESAKEGAIARQRHILDAAAAPPLVSLLQASEDGAREAAAATLSCLVMDSDELRERLVEEAAGAEAIAPLVLMARAHDAPDGRADAVRVLKAIARRADTDAAAIARELRLDAPAAARAATADSSGAGNLCELLDRLAVGEARPDSAHTLEEVHSDDIYSDGSQRAASPFAVGAAIGASPPLSVEVS